MERLEVLVDDISKSRADAIVCVTNTILPGGTDIVDSLLGIAGVDVTEEMNESGAVSLLPGKQLSVNHILWAVGPEWQGGNRQEPKKLAACYQACLELAVRERFETLDLFAVTTGVYDSQLFQVATTTLQTVRDFLSTREFPKKVRIVCQDDKMVMAYKQAYNFWFADTKASRMQYEGWD